MSAPEFEDTALREYLEATRASGFLTTVEPEQRPILELMAALDRFRGLDGAIYDCPGEVECPRLREVIAKLVSPENREGLRVWYAGKHMNPAARQFRDALARMIGEKLG